MRRRQRHRKGGAFSRLGEHRHMAAAQLYHPVYDGQTQTVAAAVWTGFGPVELIEYMPLGLLIHALASIGHGHSDLTLALPQHHGDLSAGGGKADGIGEQVGPDVLQ